MSDKVEKAVEMLQEEYSKAKQQAYIRKPMAYALYETWKKFDEMEKVRGEE